MERGCDVMIVNSNGIYHRETDRCDDDSDADSASND